MSKKLEASPEALERLGVVVEAYRRSLGYRQDNLPHGPSSTTTSAIERGEAAVPGVYRKLENSFKWPIGTVASILAGGDPPPVPPKLAPVHGITVATDSHFERAERLLSLSRTSAQHGDFLGSIHGLEAVQSMTELLIDRISDEVIRQRQSASSEKQQQVQGDVVQGKFGTKKPAPLPPGIDDPRAVASVGEKKSDDGDDDG